MPKLPQVKYRVVENILMKKGFSKRSTKSSHMVFTHPDGRRTVVPVHNKTLPKGTLHAILRQADISLDEFLKLLH